MNRAYLCAEDGGGCGVLWTPHGSRRPVRDPEINAEWRWCPDCLLDQEEAA